MSKLAARALHFRTVPNALRKHPRGRPAAILSAVRVDEAWNDALSVQTTQTMSLQERTSLLASTDTALQTLLSSYAKDYHYKKLSVEDQSQIRDVIQGQKSFCDSMRNWSHIYGGESDLAEVFDATNSAKRIKAPSILGVLESTADTLRELAMTSQPEMYYAPATNSSVDGAE